MTTRQQVQLRPQTVVTSIPREFESYGQHIPPDCLPRLASEFDFPVLSADAKYRQGVLIQKGYLN